MLTDFLLYGWHAPLFAGKSQGFYTDEAIDLTLQAGKGSADGATQVSAGAAQFGQLDAVSALTAHQQGRRPQAGGRLLLEVPRRHVLCQEPEDDRQLQGS